MPPGTETKGFSENPQTLGEHLKKRRIERGLRQRDAAGVLGVSVDTYSGWETDRVRPHAASWRAVIGLLGYDPNPARTALASASGPGGGAWLEPAPARQSASANRAENDGAARQAASRPAVKGGAP